MTIAGFDAAGPPGSVDSVIVCGKLPSPTRSGLDLRVAGIAKGLAHFGSVAILATGGVRTPQPEFAQWWEVIPGDSELDQLQVAAASLAGNPFAMLHSQARSDFLRTRLQQWRPNRVVISRVQQWPLAAAIRDVFDGTVILDLDENAAPLAASISATSQRRPADRLRQRFLDSVARYEASIIAEPDAIWVSSEEEFDHLQRLHVPYQRVDVIPNVVDVTAYQRSSSDRRGAMFPGNFSYPPNLEAANELIDCIAPRLPHVEFHIAGSHIPPSLRGRAAANVRVSGPIDDMAAEFASSEMTVVPLRAGGGTRLKVLESMASGTPVVTTSLGVAGLHMKPDVHCLIADTTDDLVKHIEDVHRDPHYARAIADQAADLVANRYSIDAVTLRLERALEI